MNESASVISVKSDKSMKIDKWKIREGFQITNNQVILLYKLIDSDDIEIKRLKSSQSGVVKSILFKDGDVVNKGETILELGACIHNTVIKDMCADCGADLRQEDNGQTSEASVPMIHSVPELKVTQKLAEELGKADTVRLLNDRKLVLLVDLDQTLIHTTNDNIPNNLKGVYHFQLYGANSPWYHTRLRPGTFKFLSNMAPFYELHICTFGARNYAHMIAQFLDEDGKYFSHRILSRDECFNLTSKTDNLKALFPCGDSMVCIIDDREDVWNMASNLIQVKPYHFFQHTGDINAPPGMAKHELDGKGVNFKDLVSNKDDKQNKSETAQSKINDDTLPSTSDANDADKKTNDTNVLEEVKETEEEKLQSTSATENIPLTDTTAEAATTTTSPREQPKKETKPTPSKNNKQTTDESNKIVNSDSDDNLIDVEDPDDYLLYLEEILKKIHKRFYKFYEENKSIPDLKILVPKIRSEVLTGKNLVFSGLVPNQLKLQQSKAYLIAKSLGANVTGQLTEETTHLVAATAGTFKANAAKKRTEINIVTPDWLWACAERWECVEEKLYPLDATRPSKMRQPPAHCHSPEHVVNYSEISEQLPPQKSEQVEEPQFKETINPLLSFSNADLAEMNKDFDTFFESDSSSDDEPVDIENPPIDKKLKRKRKREDEKEEASQRKFFREEQKESAKRLINSQEDDKEKNSDNSSNTENEDEDEMPSQRFRRGGDLPSDLDIGDDSAGSNDPIDEEDDGDWNMMGAALEREFLGLE